MRILWKAYKLILEGKNKFGQIWWEMAENMANMHFHALEEFRRPKKGFWRRKKNSAKFDRKWPKIWQHVFLGLGRVWKAYKLILEGKNKFGQIWRKMAENMANMYF